MVLSGEWGCDRRAKENIQILYKSRNPNWNRQKFLRTKNIFQKHK